MRRFSLLIGLTLLLAVPLVPAEEGQIHLTLTGHWVGAAADGTEVSYAFSREGTVVWRVKEEAFSRAFPEGLKARYLVRVGKPLCEIDMFDFSDPRFKEIRFRGILEILDAQTFKMEGQPSNKGDRPREFNKEAIVFRARKG